MDNFGAISASVNRGNGMNTSASSTPAIATKTDKKSIELLSDQALNEMLDKMRKRLQGTSDPKVEALIQAKIEALESEVVRRNVSDKPVVDAPDSAKAQEQSSSIGANVGTGALLFGIIGVVAGYSMNRDKVFMWGAGGVILGGLTAYFLTSTAQK